MVSLTSILFNFPTDNLLAVVGSLESPGRRDVHVIKFPREEGLVVTIIRKWLSCAACLFFLPISILGRVIEFILTLKSQMSSKSSSLEGKVVLITGASSGLGEALAQCLYKEGCRLIVAARRYAELERVRDQLLGSGLRKGNVYPPVIIQLDLQELNNLPDKMKTVLGVYGHIDILINNAGVSYRGEVIDTSLDVDIQIMNINYFGTIALTKGIKLLNYLLNLIIFNISYSCPTINDIKKYWTHCQHRICSG